MRESKKKSLPDNGHFIVAIGASAGGLEAIHEFFDNMPSNGHFSFVIIQHLSPDYKSLLVELVAKHTNMKVVEAQHQMKVEKNYVYVIPNDKLLTIKDGNLQLAEKNFEKAPNTAIDTFLKSLAEDQGAKAIAVILSGTGTDGTKGISAIQNSGGMVLVQDPISAKFNGMPNSAIASGYVDYILSPELMPEEIFNYIKESPVRTTIEGQPDEALLPEVLKLVEKNCQYDFYNYKTPTILRRIGRRMIHLGYKNFTEYLNHLRQSPEECKILGKEFLIGVTKFFRDKAAFDILREEVLPEIIGSKDDSDILKIWVTACSTGEEAYSLAMIVDDVVQRSGKDLEVKIFATDIDLDAIEFASKGCYPANDLSDVDSAFVKKYFTRQGSNVVVNPEIRKQIVFARHNILKDPPFIKNDLVSCRNMLIYMNVILQRKVLSTLQFSLNTGGFLFLGPSEIPASVREGFEEINGKWKFYRKISNDNRYNPERFPSTQAFKLQREIRSYGRDNTTAKELAEDFKNILADEYGFAAVYVDRDLEIKEAVGDFKKYLSLPDRISNLQILKMVSGDLSIALNAAIRKANKENTKITLNNIRIKKENAEKNVNIFIRPATRDGYMLIVFSESHEVPFVKSTTEFTPQNSEDAVSYISELEEELKETRANLQLTVESLETANEELQSSNEELLSANEELQSSNEELQSLNEELHTLNTEHQLRIKELIELNDDLNNYFRSSELAQIFVDRELRIRKFNPTAVKMVNLIETDIGRPIDHISTNIRNINLVGSINSVIKTGNSVEREVFLNNNTISLMRILPYVRQDQSIDGVVITFIDISKVKELDNIIKGVFNSSVSAIMAFKAVKDERKNIVDFRWIAANHEADLLLNRSQVDYIGRSLKEEFPQLAGGDIFEKAIQVIVTGRPIQTELEINVGDEIHCYELVANQMSDGLVMTLTNIDDRKEFETRLKENLEELVLAKENYHKLNIELEEKIKERTGELENIVQEFKFVTDFMPQMVWATQPDGYHDFYNKQWYNYTGLSFEETKGKGWNEVVHPEDQQRAWQIWSHSLKTGEPYEVEYRFKRYDGEYRWFLGRALPLKDENGEIVKWFGTCTDIHDQKLVNEILEQKVKERTNELQKANAELEASNTELLQFASVASHDLKEPLRKIHIFSNLIKDRYLANMDGASEYIERVITASARMTKLINDLLTFTRLSINSSYENVSLNRLVDEVMSDLELVITEKHAIIEVDDLPKIDAITGQIRQVFQNIISNALKFSKKDERPRIKITGELVDRCAIDAKKKTNGDFVRITIKDNGIGFDEQFSEKIFTIFQRLHTKEQYEGTGIGLAITRKIIEKHKGVITASGKEGDGAKFVIVLPLKQEMGIEIEMSEN